MGILANFLRRRDNTNAKFREAQTDQRILKLLAQKEMSGEERELRQIQEKNRLRRIKQELEFERIKQHLEDKSRNLLKAPNIFKDDRNRILNDHNSLIKFGERSPFFGN